MSEAKPLAGSRPYHHGDLRQALLTEAERILETGGIQALTLRAAARAVGVTHAAPANHFGDLAGLLSELAADGFRRLSAAMSAAIEQAGQDPRERAMAMGRAYMMFTRAYPGLFTLMFRSERLDPERPSLQEAIAAARQTLRGIVMERSPVKTRSALAVAARSVALWSLVHGYSMLMLDGRLNGTLAALQGEITAETFFDAVLDAVMLS